ncbi:MAG: adenylate/guanylate cyclase domain-containing protein [Treponema sp.]|nr:adenylate/guanylate cyclase domain-containing protein [Treponema sp.]
MTKRNVLHCFIPFICVAVSSLFLFTSLDSKFSDLYQRIALPSTQLRDDVLLVNIDDYSVDTIGSFPFTRDVYADCIAVMEELNANAIVFDLTFIDHAKASVNDDFQPFWPDEVMEEALEKSKNVYLNFTFDYETDVDSEAKEVMDEKGLLKNFELISDGKTQEFTGVMPAIPEFLQHAAGAGYVNADPDSDNYYRRVNPIAMYDGEYYGQLILPAILKKYGNPKVEIHKRKLVLKDALLEDGSRKDIVVPRGNDGKIILKYPKLLFNDYNYISIGDIYKIALYRRYMAEEGEEYYIDEYNQIYEELKEKLNGALCIIGTCATSTSDYGVNQYEPQYPLPGVHYTLANQYLNRDFVAEISPLFSILYALLCSFLIIFFTNFSKSTVGKSLIGFITVCVSSFLLLIFYKFTRIYVGESVPLIATVLTYFSTILIEFFSTSKDKKFITNAFSQCLSKDVVNQIVAHPDSFKLGGENLQMTAIFTDIQKFSSFSELLSASQLVALLNYYLTKMSDIIMAEGGTIDKYEGDAIIALVGAPLKWEDHAVRAVKAALNMKKAERLMNEEIKKTVQAEKPDSMDETLYSAFKIMVQNGKQIFTRIGINSGEMIAGYMGSENKKNYTMMGNNVNLAARLEGVNKQYSTFGILISEATYKLLNKSIICRRLDTVQVVNVNTPIILYEPLGMDDENLEKYASNWEILMKLFDSGEYTKALEGFKSLSEKNPKDMVAKYYVNLLERFFVQGKAPEEKDDFGVVYNSELKCFRLLSK